MGSHDWSTDNEESSSVCSVCSSEPASVLALAPVITVPIDPTQDRSGIPVPSAINGDVRGNESEAEFIECPSKENVLGRALLGGTGKNEYSETSDEEWLHSLLTPRAAGNFSMVSTSSSHDFSDESELHEGNTANTFNEKSDEEWLHTLLAPRVSIGFRRPSTRTLFSISSSAPDTDESDLSLYETSDDGEADSHKAYFQTTDEQWLHTLLAPRATGDFERPYTPISISSFHISEESDLSIYEDSDEDDEKSDKEVQDVAEDECLECKALVSSDLNSVSSLHSGKTELSSFETSDENPLDTSIDSSDTIQASVLDKDKTGPVIHVSANACDDIKSVDSEATAIDLSSDASQEESIKNVDSVLLSLVTADDIDDTVYSAEKTVSEQCSSSSPDFSSITCGTHEVSELGLDKQEAGSDASIPGASENEPVGGLPVTPLEICDLELASGLSDASISQCCDSVSLDTTASDTNTVSTVDESSNKCSSIPDVTEPDISVEEVVTVIDDSSEACSGPPSLPKTGFVDLSRPSIVVTADSESVVDDSSSGGDSEDAVICSNALCAPQPQEDTPCHASNFAATMKMKGDVVECIAPHDPEDAATVEVHHCIPGGTGGDTVDCYSCGTLEDGEGSLSGLRDTSGRGDVDNSSHGGVERDAGSILELNDTSDASMYVFAERDNNSEYDRRTNTDTTLENPAPCYDDDLECKKPTLHPTVTRQMLSNDLSTTKEDVALAAALESRQAKRRPAIAINKPVCICVAVVAAIAVAVGVAVFVTQYESSSQSSPDLCGLDLDVETGAFNMSLSALTRLADDAEVRLMEGLVEEAYRSVSAGCDDVFKRFPQEASLTKQGLGTGPGGESLLAMSWSLRVKCDRCPPVEPLFSNRSSTQQERIKNDGTQQKESSTTKSRRLATRHGGLRRSRQMQGKDPSVVVADGSTGVDPERFFRKCEELLHKLRDDGKIESTFNDLEDGVVVDSEGKLVFTMTASSTSTPTAVPVGTPTGTLSPSPTGTSPAPATKPVSSIAPTPLPSLVASPSSAPTSTASPITFVTIRSAALYGNLCIEVPDSAVSENVALILGECSDSENQLWHMDGNGLIHSYLDYDRCMHVQVEDAVVPNGALIELANCRDGETTHAEKWIWNAEGQIQSLSNPNQCIDGNFEGDIIYSWDCSLSKDQIWL